MNKIPQFFRKSKTQTGEAETSPTKEILTPAELEKLTRKVKSELASAELRIDYIKGRQHCPKEGDSREIEQLEAEITDLELKYTRSQFCYIDLIPIHRYESSQPL